MTELAMKEYAQKHGLSYSAVVQRARKYRVPCVRIERRCKKGSLTFIYDEATLAKAMPNYKEPSEGITLQVYCDKHNMKFKNVQSIVLRKAVRPIGTLPATTGCGRPSNLYNEKELNKAMVNVFKRRGEV